MEEQQSKSLGLRPDDLRWRDILIGSTPDGTWTSIESGFGGRATIAMYMVSLVFFGMMATFLQGSPEGFQTGIFYAVLIIFCMLVWFVEVSNPGTPGIATVDLGSVDRWALSIPIGAVIGMAFAVGMNYALGAFVPFETLTVFGIEIEMIVKVLAPVVFIPIAEEAFFGGVLTPTLTESFGLIIAVILVCIVWVAWHLGVYQTDTTVMVALVAFRVIATLVIFYTKSLMPSIIAHVFINFFGIMFAA